MLASDCLSQPIKSIKTFCIKHVEFIHPALNQLSKVFCEQMLFFHFQGKEVSFLACSPNFKNRTTLEAKIYSAAQITSNNHNSGSISKGTLVN